MYLPTYKYILYVSTYPPTYLPIRMYIHRYITQLPAYLYVRMYIGTYVHTVGIKKRKKIWGTLIIIIVTYLLGKLYCHRLIILYRTNRTFGAPG